MLEGASSNDTDDAIPKSQLRAASGQNTQAARHGDPALRPAGGVAAAGKRPIPIRMRAGAKRFVGHTKHAIFRSWINILLVFVPIGIVVKAVGLNVSLVFAMNAIAIVPLAGLLAYATECVAARMGDTLGALLNVSFGNAVELIIFIIALVKDEIRIVQASLLGSILANLLLILGMAFLFGGLRFREQIYNSTVTQMSACLLSLSVTSLLLPTAFHASFSQSSSDAADRAVLKVSRGTSVILLIVYMLYLLFQLKSHAYMYESTPQEIIDEESHPGVLAEIMNSSSSSDDMSFTDSTDTDTSGSIITKGKRFRKKMLKRRRRKSSASVSSTTPSSVVPSALSSPSTTERHAPYWEMQVTSPQSSRRESALQMIASGDEAEADDYERNSNFNPRIRDFVQANDSAILQEDDKSTDRRRVQKKRRHHRHRRHNKKHRQPDEGEETMQQQEEAIDGAEEKRAEPKVGWADDVEGRDNEDQERGTVASPNKLASNMRQLSSRAHRPALPKYLTNTVFNTPPPGPEPRGRPVQPALSRARSEAYGLRRTSSLPDRLNQQGTVPDGQPIHPRSEPIPPFEARVSRLSEVAEHADAIKKAPEMSRTTAVVLLLVSTALVAVCAEFMVGAIPGMIAASPAISEAFVGLIILPIVGNAAEHVTAVTVATKNKMDLAIGVAVGSSIQIALFVTPIVVLLGWILGTDMGLYFNLFETISLFVTAFVVNFLVLDGRSNYLEGSLLIAAYVIIALGAFFYPSSDNQSLVGGAGIH